MRLSRRAFVKKSGAWIGAALVPYSPSGAALLDVPLSGSAGEIPRMVVRDFSRRFDPAYLSNGLIGIRPGPNPLEQAPAAVSGFVYESIPFQMQALSPAPYPLAMDIEIDGVSLLRRPDLLEARRQELDMYTGELVTELSFHPAPGTQLELEVVQFASRSVPALLCQEVRITSPTTVRGNISAQIGIRGVPGTVYKDRAPEETEVDLVLGLHSHGGLSRLGAAVTVLPQPGIQRTNQLLSTDDGVARRYELVQPGGETRVFQVIAAMVSQFYHPEPVLETIRIAKWGAVLGFGLLRQENRQRWAELWKSRVRIFGDPESQKVLDTSFFYLHSSLNASDMTGMPPFGLSQTRAYYGHSFWDTESWSLIPVTLAAPDTAKSLLRFRRQSLESARKLAALYGYRGAQFPWEAAPDGGFETTPTFAATGWEEQHITPDVALGFWEYQLAAGDVDFLKHAAWPLLKAVAEWIVSRGVYTSRGFEILHIMGPDENAPNVNNDAYVNVICKMVLNAAGRCAQMAGETVPASWKRAAQRMYFPVDHARNIMLPCDHPPSGENYPIGGLAMLTVHDPPIDRDLLRSTFNYEEAFRARRRPGIGFSVAAVGATAAFLGYRRRARELFGASWQSDWIEPFGMLKEAPVETYGCFLTNCGSLLQTAMLGFTGLRIREGDWRAFPASLPEGWSRIEIERLWVRGEPKALVAENGRPVRWLSRGS